MSAERIVSEPITKAQRERLARLAEKPDSAIDVSDIAPLTDEQLAQMVPDRLRSKGPGHLSRINAILANVMEAEQRLKGAS